MSIKAKILLDDGTEEGKEEKHVFGTLQEYVEYLEMHWFSIREAMCEVLPADRIRQGRDG